MAASFNPRSVRWLRGELPALIASGAITPENARAIERFYEMAGSARRNFGFALLASIGSALVAAGIILLIAHNWDDFGRPLRSVIAFVPLLAAQLLSAFVLLRRDETKPWRESAAIFNIAAIGTAISLISQTYQIQGSFSQFILAWLFLSLPLIYLLRTVAGTIAYLIGASVWIFQNENWLQWHSPLRFWLLLVLAAPYFALVYRRQRESWETTVLALAFAVTVSIGILFTSDFTRVELGGLSFAGLCAGIYLCGIEFFGERDPDHLPSLALLGGLAIGVTAIVLSFQQSWFSTAVKWPNDPTQIAAIAIQLLFPIAAAVLAVWSFSRGKIHFSMLAAVLPIVAAIGWLLAQRGESFAASVLFDAYALALGAELIARGIRAESVTRANFGLLVISALALARFFDSDLSFVTRAIGFIVIGLGFLFTNLLFFRRRRAA